MVLRVQLSGRDDEWRGSLVLVGAICPSYVSLLYISESAGTARRRAVLAVLNQSGAGRPITFYLRNMTFNQR